MHIYIYIYIYLERESEREYDDPTSCAWHVWRNFTLDICSRNITTGVSSSIFSLLGRIPWLHVYIRSLVRAGWVKKSLVRACWFKMYIDNYMHLLIINICWSINICTQINSRPRMIFMYWLINNIFFYIVLVNFREGKPSLFWSCG